MLLTAQTNEQKVGKKRLALSPKKVRKTISLAALDLPRCRRLSSETLDDVRKIPLALVIAFR
jgi:hypothetical protein